MGKFNFGVESGESADLGEGFYDGDAPPKGNYWGEVKNAKMNINSSGDYRISVLVEVSEEDEEKSKYNGAAMWCGLNINDAGKPWINNFLDAIGASRKDFWAEKITTSPGKIDKDTKQDVLKIGTRKVTGHRVLASGGPRTYNGTESFDIKRFLDREEGNGSDDVAPDADAAGLDDDATTPEETPAEATGDGEGYTQEELDELEPKDLKGICDEWEIAYAAKATKATLIKAILKAQNEPADDESDEGHEPDSDADATVPESGGDDAGEELTEEDLADLDKTELLAVYKEKGWDVPSPAIPSRMRKQILELQAEPPF